MEYALIFSLIGGIVAGCFFWHHFCRGSKDKMPHYQQIDPVENAQVSALCMEVLKEGVRASEARFEEMNSAKIELERKAQWLAAFCLGALIFLFKDDLTGVIFWEAAIRLAAIIFLAIAAAWFAAVSSLDLMFYGNRGLIPAVVVSDWLKKDRDEDRDKSTQLPLLLYHLLSEYNKRIAQSDESNHKKRNVFSRAKKYLAVGVSLTVSVILLPFLTEAVPKAQAWLAAYDL